MDFEENVQAKIHNLTRIILCHTMANTYNSVTILTLLNSLNNATRVVHGAKVVV